MLNFLLGLHFVLALMIIALVLMQKHDSDGALGSGGNSANGMFSVRGQANVLTRTTAVLMTIFILNCLVMAKIVKKNVYTKSVIDRVAEESAAIVDKNAEKDHKNDKTTTHNQNMKKESVPANKEDVSEVMNTRSQGNSKMNDHSTQPGQSNTSANKTESKGKNRK